MLACIDIDCKTDWQASQEWELAAEAWVQTLVDLLAGY